MSSDIYFFVLQFSVLRQGYLRPCLPVPAPTLTCTAARAYPYLRPCAAMSLFSWIAYLLFISELEDLSRFWP